MDRNGKLSDREMASVFEAVDDIYGRSVDESDVFGIDGSFADFIASHGEADEIDTAENGLVLRRWYKAQAHKGAPRQDIIVVEFANDRCAVVN